MVPSERVLVSSYCYCSVMPRSNFSSTFTRFRDIAAFVLQHATFSHSTSIVSQKFPFFNELAAVFEILVLQLCPIIVGGDLNVRTDVNTARLTDMLSAFGMVQRVTGHSAACLMSSSHVTTTCQPTSVSTHRTWCLTTRSSPVDCRSHLNRRRHTSAAFVRGDPSIVDCCVTPLLRAACAIRCRRRLTWTTCSPTTMPCYETSLTVSRLNSTFARTRPRPLSPWFDTDCRTERHNCLRLVTLISTVTQRPRPSCLRRCGAVEVQTVPGQERCILAGACTR